MSAHVDHVTCQQLVEALTDYLEGVMEAQQRADIERHIVFCRGCSNYVQQLRETIALVGRIAEEEQPPSEHTTELLSIFRRWKEERQAPS